MNRKVSRFSIATMMAIALTAGLGMTATADSPTVNTPNGNASGKWQSTPDTWRLCDLAVGRSVYIHAGTTKALAESGQRRYENFNGGCIDTIAYNLTGNPWWRVCENISGGPDNCSTARQDTR